MGLTQVASLAPPAPGFSRRHLPHLPFPPATTCTSSVAYPPPLPRRPSPLLSLHRLGNVPGQQCGSCPAARFGRRPRSAVSTGAVAWSCGGAPFPTVTLPATAALSHPSPPSPPLLFPTLPSVRQVVASASSNGGAERRTSPFTPRSPDGGGLVEHVLSMNLVFVTIFIKCFLVSG
ncbi:hypothetical protein PVAP13_7KG058109 [Panicum virgatum]|uniref:Uncharacterized protein n=1 Tax=Panicum virgatum TaxID=38727 RepID=A0A8T0QAZ6_PANVG|nr:hypothetical protein PVAP13_7KG058109 [Panicum virgatum]